MVEAWVQGLHDPVKHLFSVFCGLFAMLAALLSLMADAPVTQWKWGCEWQQPANGNYWPKVDGGCKHWIALGYDRHRDLLGMDIEDDEDDRGNEPDPGETPSDDKAV